MVRPTSIRRGSHQVQLTASSRKQRDRLSFADMIRHSFERLAKEEGSRRISVCPAINAPF